MHEIGFVSSYSFKCVMHVGRIQVFALIVFFIGYFPLKAPMPGYASSTSTSVTPKPVFGRLVFMLIDALRADFVFSSDTNMMFVDQLRRRGDAVSFVARAQIPTVTMPRIKVSDNYSIIVYALPLGFDFTTKTASYSLYA